MRQEQNIRMSEEWSKVPCEALLLTSYIVMAIYQKLKIIYSLIQPQTIAKVLTF